MEVLYYCTTLYFSPLDQSLQIPDCKGFTAFVHSVRYCTEETLCRPESMSHVLYLSSGIVGSLYALMIQLIVVITSKVSSNPWFLVAVLGVTSKLMFYVHSDTQIIMQKAMVIFSTPSKPRNSLITAMSTMSMYDEKSYGTDDDTSASGKKSDKDSVRPKRTGRTHLKKKTSTMTMAATEFRPLFKSCSSGKSMRWSAGDLDEENERSIYSDSTGPQSMGGSVASALDKAGLRRRNSGKSQSDTSAHRKRKSVTLSGSQTIINYTLGNDSGSFSSDYDKN